jgi:xanthosine utilization system XapX-like protein
MTPEQLQRSINAIYFYTSGIILAMASGFLLGIVMASREARSTPKAIAILGIVVGILICTYAMTLMAG